MLTARRSEHSGSVSRQATTRSQARFEHPPLEVEDECAALGDGDELRRRDRADPGAVPAHERLGAPALAGLHVEDRLEVELQLVVADRFPQCQLELGALFDRNLQVVVVELHPPTPTTLGEVHRGVGLLDRDHRRRARLGDRQPDARRDGEQVVAEAERLLDLADQSVAERRDRRHVLEAAHHDQELVATETGHEVAGTHPPSDPIGDLAQHEVAGRVTVRVVDALEAVDVDEHHRALVVAVHQHALEVLEHGEPVGEAGQRIVAGLVSELLLELLALRDVAGEHRQQRLRLGRHHDRLCQHRDRRSLRRAHQLLTVERGQELGEHADRVASAASRPTMRAAAAFADRIRPSIPIVQMPIAACSRIADDLDSDAASRPVTVARRTIEASIERAASLGIDVLRDSRVELPGRERRRLTIDQCQRL